MTTTPKTRLATLLLLGTSSLSFAGPVLASDILFSSKGDTVLQLGERINQLDGLKQIQLDNGAVVSILNAADYRINADGSVDLYAGSVTVAGGNGTTVVRMPEGVEGQVSGRVSAATFSVGPDGKGRGHVLTGQANIGPANALRRFQAGELFAFEPGDSARQVVANAAQETPAATGEAQAPVVADMASGGPAAAAQNGLPVTLGDALAAAGASGDVLAAARRVDAALVNPAIETFPSGDFALLVAGAAGLQGAYGGTPFPGAQADIIRAYLGYLAGGRSGADFLTAYAGFLGQYLDLMRSGAAPSSFGKASLADINAFIGFAGRTGRLGQLGAQDRILVDAYLAFLKNGGNADLFVGSYTNLTTAYFAFVRGGGDPLAFAQANKTTLDSYIRFLADSGLSAQLSAADRALITAYLGNGGLAFTSQYRVALDNYFAFLASGQLPSRYTTLDAATLRNYLETLSNAGLLAAVAGDRAKFYGDYLVYLRGGGAIDGFAGLPANIFAGYTTQLNSYFAFLAAGNLPSTYTAGDIKQLQSFVAQLQAAGALDRFLGERAQFFTAYAAFLQGGGQVNAFPGLNANIFAGYATQLNAYFAYLAAGNLPSGYTAVSTAQLQAYLAQLKAAGALDRFLGSQTQFFDAYLAFLTGGGQVNAFPGLNANIFAGYARQLTAYHTYLVNGGVPSAYGELSQDMIKSYLAALNAAGASAAFLVDLSSFYGAYFEFLNTGGNPDTYAGLPVPPNYPVFASALNAYAVYLTGGGLPTGYTAEQLAKLQNYFASVLASGQVTSLLGANGDLLTKYFAYLKTGGTADGFSGLPVYANYVTALNSYYVYLAGGGLPSGYTALTQDQIKAYLTALNGAGGLSAYANINAFFAQYYAFIANGGTAAQYSGLPVYANYVTALNAYYAYLAGGGLPAGYTALTQDQIKEYLTALNGAGGLSAYANINAFFTQYYAFIAAGGNAANYSGLPVYATYLTAVKAYYVFIQGGGKPSAYTALTQDQIKSYLAALSGAGVLQGQLAGAELKFLTDYLAYVQTGASPDQFAGLPTTTPTNPQYAGGFVSGATGTKAYAVHAGTSYSASDKPVLDSQGSLTNAGDLAIGTAKSVDVAGDASVVIGRYVDGTAKFRGGNVTVGSNGGIPWLVTAPLVTPLPTSGNINYIVQSATKPVFASGRGTPGTFDANLTIGFGPLGLKYGFDGKIIMPESTGNVRYDFASQGRPTGALLEMGRFNPLLFTGSMTGSGDACRSNNCLINLFGDFGGSKDRVGLVYQTLDNTNFQTAERIQGAAIFVPKPGDTGGNGATGVVVPTKPATGLYENQYLINVTFGNFDAHYRSNVMYGDDHVLWRWSRDNGSITTVGRHGPVAESGSVDKVIGWTRWLDLNNFQASDPLLPNTGNHILSGTLATSLPTSGAINYSLIGSTKPTDRSGQLSPGTFTGSVAVDFATKKVGFDFNIGIDKYGWNVKTSGGIANAGKGGLQLTGNGEISGAALISGTTAVSCTRTCSAQVRGALFGAGATHFGATYVLQDTGAANLIVMGLGAFAMATPVASAPPPVAASRSTDVAADWGRWSGAAAGSVPPVPVPVPGVNSPGTVTGSVATRAQAERLLGGLVTFSEER